MEFKFHSPTKVHFGYGARKKLVKAANNYGKKCLIVRTAIKNTSRENYFNKILNDLKDSGLTIIIFDQVKPNPTTAIVNEGVEIAIKEEVDFIIGIGGGSSLDTAKAIALRSNNPDYSWNDCFEEFSEPFDVRDETVHALPLLTVTTTSGTGSQVTQAAVITDLSDNEKKTLFHTCLFPKESIIDPELMKTVPKHITAVTGFDALSHAIESYLNPRASLLTETHSLQAIEIIIETLPKLINDLENETYREKILYADLLAGICLSNAGAEAPHPIAEIINGYYPNMAHGETLAFVYPNYLAYVSTVSPEKVKILLDLFETNGQPGEVISLSHQSKRTMTAFLESIGLTISASSLKMSNKVKEEIYEKLCFDLPLTDAENMRRIFGNCVDD